MKACGDCGLQKPLEMFNINPKGKFGRRSNCKECQAAYVRAHYRGNQAAHIASTNTYRAANRDRLAAARVARINAERAADPEGYRRQRYGEWIRHRYKMSLAEFDALLHLQGGACAICGRVPDKFQVDHDHDTGIVRGLLCRGCNTLLGQASESEAILSRAIEYLQAHSHSGQED